MFTKRSESFFILTSFLVWRVGVLIIAMFAIRFVPLFSHNFLGGGYSNYILNPLFLGHLNFDGEHYLSIAQNGYRPLEYFFFPVYPKLIDILSVLKTQADLVWVGLEISNFSFLIALFGIYRLVKLDYEESVAKLTVVLFLIFPTSFYFGMYYTESIFLMFAVWIFYFARKNKFLFASLIAAFASATKVIGGAIFASLLIETYLQKKKNFLPVLVAPFGVLIYMYYLLKQTGDPLIFLHQVSIFGQQRSTQLILLPQVFYRYIFEILPHVSYSYFPNVFTTYLEFACGVIVLILVIYSFFKLRLSYAVYGLLAYLIPALAGSFSSMPRYVLVIFPVFILAAVYLNHTPKIYRLVLFSVMLLFMAISIAMFWRGYWIS